MTCARQVAGQGWQGMLAPATIVTMIGSVTEVLSQALKLPAEVRAFVAARLIESLDVSDDDNFDISPAWLDELRRRGETLDHGEAETQTPEDFLTALRGRLE